jgi:putative transcriptional regulator
MELDIQNLDSSIFKINLPTGKPALGSLLVAEPFLREEYFNHGVISLIEYELGKSAMGLVLNKPTGYTLGDAIEGINDEVDIPIYCGGPLSCDRLFYLHSLGNEFNGAKQIADNLFVGGDFQQVKDYVNMGCDTDGKMRFFVGYSGWDPHQLEEEISKHVWAVAPKPANEEIFREDGDSFWYRIVRLLGDSYKNWLYHPVNPQYN